jgi:hypothetical protein
MGSSTAVFSKQKKKQCATFLISAGFTKTVSFFFPPFPGGQQYLFQEVSE